MKKLLGFLFGLIVLAVAAVLIGPSFINWNDYKDEMARRVHEMTGRQLAINGDIRIAVLPAPALVAGDISFANADGAAARNMATLKSVEVRVALGPLLGGQVKVETVKLVEPVIHLERLADGRVNWEFPGLSAGGAAKDGKPAEGPVPATAETAVPAIALDNLSVENGTLVYTDAITGTAERIDKLNARIAAASLKGPLETAGSLTVRKVPLSFSVKLGEIIHDRTVPVTMRAETAAGSTKLQLSGTLVNLSEVPKFKGAVKLTGTDLARAMAAFGGAAGSPLLARAFSTAGDVTATAKDIEIQNLELGFGEVRAVGDLRLDMADKIRVGGRLGVKRIDADALLRGAPKPAGQKPAKKPAGETKTAAAPPAKKPATGPLRFEIPADVEGSLILSVDAVSYGQGVVRDALANVELAGGVLTVSQASAQFPGGSDFSASGRLATPKGVPSFSGELESTVNDLRGVLGWLEIKPPAVPADRLRKLSFRTKLAGTPEQVQVTDLDLRFDSSRVTGGITVALRERLGFGSNLTLDRLNLDAYLPPPAKGKTPSKKPAAAKSAPAGASGKTPSAKPANPFSALSALTAFDANMKTHIKTLVYRSSPIKDLVADATLYNGDLEIRRFSIAKAAGASAKLSGKLKGLSGVPKASGMRFEAKVADLNRLARLAGTALPAAIKKAGALSLKGRLDGSLLAPTVDATVGALGAVLGVKGRVSPLPVSDMLDARITLRHKDVARLARRLGVDYRPSGKIGGIDFAGDVKASETRVSVANLRTAIGKLAVRGRTDVNLSGPKPVINADLSADAFVVDPFLSAERRADLGRNLWRVLPAAWRPATGHRPLRHDIAARKKAERFSRDPIDLSALNAFDADIAFKAPLVAFGKFLMEKADIAATVRNGVLATRRLAGTVFDGKLNGALEAAAGPRNRVKLTAQVEGVDMAQSLRAVTGEALARGRLGVNLDLATTGRSVHEFVGGLGGTASVAMSDVDVNKAGKGSVMSGLLGLLTSLNRLGGKQADDRGQMTASFQVAGGIAKTNGVKLQSAYGNGAATGSIDLPRWTIDMQGQVELAQNLLTQLLRAKIRETRNAVPFSIRGPLDAPNVKVDTGALLGAGVPIPGADALLNKAPKGVGKILKGILGGGRTQSQQPPTQPLPSPPPQSSGGQPAPADAPPPPPSQQEQQQQPLNPEKLLKQLFKL